MSTLGRNEAVEIANAQVEGATESTLQGKPGVGHFEISACTDNDSTQASEITQHDLDTLRRVSGKIPWTAFTVALVEMCERFSYYGTTVVCVNFVQQPLPEGSTTGAGHENQSGALGLGQRAATGFGMFNQFWAYLMPLFGAYVADARYGRYKTIQFAIGFALIGHAIIAASAAPSVLQHPKSSIAAFIIGILIFAIGSGFFKSNISPLMAEQITDTKMRVTTTDKGERVLVDPAVTNSRIFLYFYMSISVGSLVGEDAMVFAEKYVGFWLSYTLPTALFLVAPVVLIVVKKNYKLTKPTGSVVATFFQVVVHASKGKWSLNLVKMKREFDWDVVKPSQILTEQRPSWMTYDDAWVDEVRRGLESCKVFLFLPLVLLAYSQFTSNMTSQAATMELHGVPNDMVQNLSPVSVILMVLIMDFLVYPALRKAHVRFTPIKRIFTGFMLAGVAMVATCVIQVYIYRLSPCDHHASTCDDPAPINVWVQTIPYVLIAISDILASTTSLEYAFTKAPSNMKSLVMAINLAMNAVSSAMGQALVMLSGDPFLVWNYGVVAVLAFVGGISFWFCFSQLDQDEDKWNMIPQSNYHGETGTPDENDRQETT